MSLMTDWQFVVTAVTAPIGADSTEWYGNIGGKADRKIAPRKKTVDGCNDQKTLTKILT